MCFPNTMQAEIRDNRANPVFFSKILSSATIYFLQDHAYLRLLSFLRRNSSSTLKSMTNNGSLPTLSHRPFIFQNPFASNAHGSPTECQYIREIDGPCHVFQLVQPLNDVRRLQDVIIATLSSHLKYFACIFHVKKYFRKHQILFKHFFVTESNYEVVFVNTGDVLNSSNMMTYGFSLPHPRSARGMRGFCGVTPHSSSKQARLPFC